MEGNGRDAARSRPFPRPRFIDPLRAEVALSSCGRRSGDEPRRASAWRSRSLTQRAGVEDLELPRAQPVEHPGLYELRERTGEALRRDPDRGRELPRPHRQLDHDERARVRALREQRRERRRDARQDLGHRRPLDPVERLAEAGCEELHERERDLRVALERGPEICPGHDERGRLFERLGAHWVRLAVEKRHEPEHVARAEEVDRDRASGRQHAEDLHASRLERYEHPGVVALAPEQGPRLERAVVRVRREERADLPGKTRALFRQGGGTRGHQGGHSSSTIYPRLCELWRTDGTAARSWWRWTPRPRPRAPGAAAAAPVRTRASPPCCSSRSRCAVTASGPPRGGRAPS